MRTDLGLIGDAADAAWAPPLVRACHRAGCRRGPRLRRPPPWSCPVTPAGVAPRAHRPAQAPHRQFARGALHDRGVVTSRAGAGRATPRNHVDGVGCPHRRRGRVSSFAPVVPHHLSERYSGRVAASPQAVELTSQPLARPAGVARPLHPGRRRVGGWWWTVVDVARESDRCADPRLDHLDDLDIPLALGDVCPDAIADPDLGGRLRVPTVDLDMTGVAELRRDRARLDQPHRCQPSVDPCLIQHPPTLPARAGRGRWPANGRGSRPWSRRDRAGTRTGGSGRGSSTASPMPGRHGRCWPDTSPGDELKARYPKALSPRYS